MKALIQNVPRTRTVACFVTVVLAAGTLCAQLAPDSRLHISARFAANIVVPQARAFAVERGATVEITAVEVGILMVEQAATTTMDISLRNPHDRRIEAELLVPVPDNAAVKGFTFQGAAAEPTAALLPKAEARRTYDAIVANIRDPALLEFVGHNLVRSSVFPVEARVTQKVRLTYDHLLTAEKNRIDYVLPRSESLAGNVPWTITAKVESKKNISTVYSPSHALDTRRKDAHAVSLRIADASKSEPGPFRLSVLLEEDGVSASLFAYPDPKTAGGYFLLLAGLPTSQPAAATPSIKREVTLVFDRSGSMKGDKIDQVREAALQIVAGLNNGEAFNILAYNESVNGFSREPVLKNPASAAQAAAFLKEITARGGTNIHDALLEVLRQKPLAGFLPIVLFLTDGIPTVGQTSEIEIGALVVKGNHHNRRVFTFGVGTDVNAPLLEKIASASRATSSFVLPKEDVEVKVAGVFNRLSGPILADPELTICDATGEPAPGRLSDLMPGRLPDLFDGDQLVLLGRYHSDEPVTFVLAGNYLGKTRTFRFQFDFRNATVKHSFVPRLWASRKIGLLVDSIRQMGADNRTALAAASDPKVKELTDEIVRLSTEFGILTEYTAFLAREGTDLSRRDEVLRQAMANFQNRAMQTRVGVGAVNQSLNRAAMVSQSAMNRQNVFYDETLNRVSVTAVQQVSDMAFYQRNGRWIDSRLVTRESTVRPQRTIEFGSDEFWRLAHHLADQGRQGAISLQGDILMNLGDETVLVRNRSAP